nr:tetratricopeptide repeat (TPR)-like superfamily protein [Tanacetum cinerariifolium]
MHTARGDGVAGIKRCRHDLSGNGVRKMMTASGHGRLKRGSRIIYTTTASGLQSDAVVPETAIENSNTQFTNKVEKKFVSDVVHKDSGVYGYWVMIEFQTEESKEKFKSNVGIEVFGWLPDFVEEDEEESDSDNEIRDEGLHDESVDKHKYATVEGESDVEEVSETIFEDEQSQAHKNDDINIRHNKIHLEDLFNIYDLLNKIQDNIVRGPRSDDNMKYPLGFTPMVATEVHSNAFNEA